MYDLPIRAVPTLDNVFVEIHMTVLFRCIDSEKDVQNFVYNISVNQLNKQLEAALTERVRVLARIKTHLEIYQIKGKDHTHDIMSFLNENFKLKGLEFTRVIVTDVKLPSEIA